MLGFILSNNKEPIYNQIYNNIKNQILSGKMSGKLPSIRELARDLGVSVITTKKTYEILEVDGFIRATPGLGYFVIFDPAKAPKHREQTLKNSIKELLRSFKVSGGKAAEFKRVLKNLMEDANEV